MPKLKKILVISSQKGGSGKSSMNSAVVAYLSRKKHANKVLDIDNDPQHSTSSLFNFSKQQRHQSELYRAFYGYDTEGQLPDDFKPAKVNDHLDVITSSSRLQTVDTLMKDNASIADLVFAQMLTDLDVPNKYDWVVIDDAPAMSLLTINSYVCADDIICPVDPGMFDLKSIGIMTNELKRLKHKMRSPQNLHESLIKARLIFIGDRIKSNTKSSKIFQQYAKSHPELFKATFRERELVNRANNAGSNIFEISRDNNSDKKIVNQEIKPNLDKLYQDVMKN